MMRVGYGGESFTTSDEAAEALLAFAAAAAMSDVAEVVQLPTVDVDGAVVVVTLVIGPSSELIMSEVQSTFSDPDTSAATQVLRDRALSLGATSSHALGGAIPGADLDSEDPEYFTAPPGE